MNTNDVGNTADEAIAPMDPSAVRESGTGANLSGSAIATIWRGQKQLRQRVLTASSPGASLRKGNRSASRDAGVARSPQWARGG